MLDNTTIGDYTMNRLTPEMLEEAASRLGEVKKIPDILFVTPREYSILQNELNSIAAEGSLGQLGGLSVVVYMNDEDKARAIDSFTKMNGRMPMCIILEDINDDSKPMAGIVIPKS